MRLRLCFSVFLCVIALKSPLAADSSLKDVSKQLKQIEVSITQEKSTVAELESRAKKLGGLIEKNQKDLVKAAEEAQRREDQLSELEKRLDFLEEQRQGVITQIRKQNQVSKMALAKILKSSQQSPLTVLALPESPREIARKWSVMRQLVPQVQERVDDLKTDLVEIQNLQNQIGAQKERVSTEKERLDQDQQWLAHLVGKRKKTFSEVSGEREKRLKEVARLAAKSSDFQELLGRLKREKELAAAKAAKKSADKLASIPDRKKVTVPAPRARGQLARGSLVVPAKGEVVTRFGQETTTGTAKGLTLRTRPDAVIVSPYDGEVVYAAPFRGYGNLIIIEHGSGYHSLLSGMSRLDIEVGQWLLSGEPVGIMGNAANGSRNLYVELRKDGQPVNITPWFAQQLDKGNG